MQYILVIDKEQVKLKVSLAPWEEVFRNSVVGSRREKRGFGKGGEERLHK